MDWELRLPPGHLGLLVPLNQQAKKGGSVLAGERLHYSGKWTAALQGDKGTGDSLGLSE